jgi:serine protease Do
MALSLKDLSTSIRKAVSSGAALTVMVERRPYPVSGVLISAERAITASHLVIDERAEIVLPGGAKATATVRARDPIHDLALLALDHPAGTARPRTAPVEVGDLVISVRLDPFDGVNASVGMVSAAGQRLRLGRFGSMERYFQVDSARMPGSTGGPIVDGDGTLVGINVFNRRMGAEVAVPADLALERADLLESTGTVQRPYLGVRTQLVELPAAARAGRKARETALLVVGVETGSPAETGGLLIGDIIVEFAGAEVSGHDDLLDSLGRAGAGAEAEAEVIRAGAAKRVTIRIGSA